MAINKRTFFLIFICFLYSALNYSQNLAKETQPLSELLSDAEKQYEITFTYVNKIISTIKIIPYDKSLTLHETIQYLKSNTPLTFTFLTSTNILINKQKTPNSIC